MQSRVAGVGIGHCQERRTLLEQQTHLPTLETRSWTPGFGGGVTLLAAAARIQSFLVGSRKGRGSMGWAARGARAREGEEVGEGWGSGKV